MLDLFKPDIKQLTGVIKIWSVNYRGFPSLCLHWSELITRWQEARCLAGVISLLPASLQGWSQYFYFCITNKQREVQRDGKWHKLGTPSSNKATRCFCPPGPFGVTILLAATCLPGPGDTSYSESLVARQAPGGQERSRQK